MLQCENLLENKYWRKLKGRYSFLVVWQELIGSIIIKSSHYLKALILINICWGFLILRLERSTEFMKIEISHMIWLNSIENK